MRLHQILTERSVQKYSENEIEQAAEFVRKACQPWLAESNNGAFKLYRGLSLSSGPDNVIIHADIRRNRRALGHSSLRYFYDNILLDGSPVKRHNSISTTSSLVEASEFGSAYVVLPVGNYNYIWSTEIVDWGAGYTVDWGLGDTVELRTWTRLENLPGAAAYDSLNDNRRLEIQELSDEIRKTLRMNRDVKESNGNEVMIEADSAVYVNPYVYDDFLKLI